LETCKAEADWFPEACRHRQNFSDGAAQEIGFSPDIHRDTLGFIPIINMVQNSNYIQNYEKT